MVVSETLVISTPGRGFTPLQAALDRALADHRLSGLCHLFLQHTSASLLLTENADPQVHRDLEAWMRAHIPDGDPIYGHTAEGPDDMPAHVRNAVIGHALTLPLRRGRLALGTWQGVFLWEHRHAPQTRRLLLTLLGEPT